MDIQIFNKIADDYENQIRAILKGQGISDEISFEKNYQRNYFGFSIESQNNLTFLKVRRALQKNGFYIQDATRNESTEDFKIFVGDRYTLGKRDIRDSMHRFLINIDAWDNPVTMHLTHNRIVLGSGIDWITSKELSVRCTKINFEEILQINRFVL